MKKVVSIAMTALLSLSFAVSGLATGVNVAFDNFESKATLEEGADIIDNASVTAAEYKDFHASSYDSGTVSNPAKLAVAASKGAKGSKALAISQTRGDDRANVGVSLYTATPIEIKGAKYFVVWADFTGVDFRKACFGVIGDDHILYRTDELDDVADLKFFVQKDGEWTEKVHGIDGCFGADQDSSVLDYVGYMAFPIEDFVSWDSRDVSFDPETQKVTGVYFYFDYVDASYSDKVFYFDEMAFMADYKDLAEAPATETEPDTTPETEKTEKDPTTPQTMDKSVYFIFLTASAVVISAVVVRKKKTA